MKTKTIKACTLILGLLFAQDVMSTPTISDLKVTPIEPLGLAIDYKVSGATAVDILSPITVTMTDGHATYIAKSLVGETNCVDGTHRVYWHVAQDGITFGETDVTVTVTYSGTRYCVIDLSDGSSADSYPVTYLGKPPSGGFNTTEYKTTKLVLKLVDAGTFTMGDLNVSDNQPHTVTLTKSFYMGLFEVTQKQWELVMNSNPATTSGTGDTYPVYYVSYSDVTSFLKCLSRKTGISFSLPSEAQWEYTCRAGTETTYSYGNNENGDYMWYRGNSYNASDFFCYSNVVGAKKANLWGFYDMHGNISEWCLDQYVALLSDGEDPVGVSSDKAQVVRGGSFQYSAEYCRSSHRRSEYPNVSSFEIGFRLSRSVP